MSELRRRVDRIRAVLAARPDGIKLGKFPPGTAAPVDSMSPGVGEVLAITDGPRGGEIVVLSAAELAVQRFSLLGAAAITDEQTDAWIRFAARNDEPLLVHRQTGEVWWFPDSGVHWMDSTVFERLADDVGSFMTDYLLGDGYLDICAGADGWGDLLVEIGWADDEPGE